MKELRALVQNNKEELAPSYEHLRFGNIPIVACGKHSTSDITVYQNGFVLYTESNHYTIFHIDTVYNKNKQYLTVDERTVPERLRTIEASVFWDLDWIIRLVMEGNERIIHNHNCAEIKKSGGTVYEALMVNRDSPEAMKIIPALNITEAYRNYEQGAEIGEILDKLAETRVYATLPGEITREDIMNYGSAKGRIYPRLVNTAANAEYLADKPHCEVKDLSLLFAVRVHEDSQGFAEAIVNDDLAGMWGVDASELRETAMDNLSQKEPFFANIEEVLFGGGVTHMPQ